ncbi:hypothetical protein BS47DRAFT_1401066 [Hydnum rufescens UP504]|uniref:Uncharacterized protein n=1 Tax=Hydnum rufescens UP504 TaxID=1448309 RepID=A0A9P6AF69_9AGAM|nr:hypothetical protein BS47DRAFT_1401066 [Hydnum rufescens UP504]
MNAIASAESALRWISKVPGGDKVQASSHDVKTLKWLEYHVRYLAELLEPFAMMHRSEISPLLQYESGDCVVELKPIAASNEDPRRKSLSTKPREEHVSNARDIRVVTQNFKSALDQFRVRLFPPFNDVLRMPFCHQDQWHLLTVCSLNNQANVLPLYPVSPIEAALLPLGVISDSSCALSSFIQAQF